MRLLTLCLCFFILVGCTTAGERSDLGSTSTSTQAVILEVSPAGTPLQFNGTPTLQFEDSTNTPIPTETRTPFLAIARTQLPTTTPTIEPVVRFAVIGDFGGGGQPEADVASLVKSWQPDFIITTGDNNYPDGSGETIDVHIGQFYHEFIYPYKGDYGIGADQNRFFPSIGNHDWNTLQGQPYLDYFTLPGNERYYDFTWGALHFFALNGDSREPDGVGRTSDQAAWLREGLAKSTSQWKIVYMHQSPYSSGIHGSIDWARWPYKEWGATTVLAGHNHSYERIIVDGFPYFVNGLGGGWIYPFGMTVEGSQVRYNEDYGAMFVEATGDYITFQFISRQGEIVDTYSIDSDNYDQD